MGWGAMFSALWRWDACRSRRQHSLAETEGVSDTRGTRNDRAQSRPGIFIQPSVEGERSLAGMDRADRSCRDPCWWPEGPSPRGTPTLRKPLAVTWDL